MTSNATPQRLYLMQVAAMQAGEQAVPVNSYLIQLSDGTNILVDSGFPDGAESWPEMGISIERDVIAQLTELGLQSTDIGVVICSHLDPDHAGQHPAFTKAQFVIQRAHEAVARGDDERFEMARPLWELPDERIRLVDGDTELVPGVELIESSGHVPGHQAVLVRLPNSGPVLLGIDALPFDMGPYTPETRPIYGYDMDEAGVRASARKLLELADSEGVTLIVYGHDEAQWRTLRTAPAYYD